MGMLGCGRSFVEAVGTSVKPSRKQLFWDTEWKNAFCMEGEDEWDLFCVSLLGCPAPPPAMRADSQLPSVTFNNSLSPSSFPPCICSIWIQNARVHTSFWWDFKPVLTFFRLEGKRRWVGSLGMTLKLQVRERMILMNKQETRNSKMFP